MRAVRLALFAAFLLGLFYLVAIMRVVDVENVRNTVTTTRPAVPMTYVVVPAALGAVFVPGPVLAAGSGMLFGPVLGTFVTLGSTVTLSGQDIPDLPPARPRPPPGCRRQSWRARPSVRRPRSLWPTTTPLRGPMSGRTGACTPRPTWPRPHRRSRHGSR